MAAGGVREVIASSEFPVKLVKWNVRDGKEVREGSFLAFCQRSDEEERLDTAIRNLNVKSPFNGKIQKLLFAEGDVIPASAPVALIEEVNECEHKTVMKDLCCDCGADLRRFSKGEDSSPTVQMVHNIPELRISLDEAEILGRKDKECLIQAHKLDLVVDLDQTLIHTTMEPVPSDMKGVHHFQLHGHPTWYHTKVRPGTFKFLQNISKLYQLHIFTMGSRLYAHTIARILDPTERLFAHRIRSRDECMDMFSKSHDLRSLFPQGDSMVCIIDDREDVWNDAPNLIRVKPYQFFKGVGDINAPPGQDVPNEKQDSSSEPSAPKEKPDATTTGNLNTQQDTIQTNHDPVKGIDGESIVTETGMKVEPEDNNICNTINDGQSETCKEEQRTEMTSAKDLVVTVVHGASDSNKKETDALTNGSQDKGSSSSEEVPRGRSQNAVEHDPTENSQGDKLPKREQQVNFNIEDDDDYLMYLEDILCRVHDLFYKTVAKAKISKDPTKDPELHRYCAPGTSTPDTKILLPEMKKDVLRGANLAFTGVIPTNTRSEDSRPWREACGLGAKVNKRVITPKDTDCPADVTTHVVAARLGTQKSYIAVKSPRMKLVNPGWLSCCAERWEWVDERLFAVEGAERYKEQIAGQATPRARSRGTPQPIENQAVAQEGSCAGSAAELEESGRARSESSSSADLLMSTIKPLLSFSASEVQAMDKEVEELMNSSGSSDDDGADLLGSVSDDSSSSSRSSSPSPSPSSTDPRQDVITSNKRKHPPQENDNSDSKKRCADAPDSSDSSGESNPSDDDDDDDADEMADLLEAELARG